MDIGPDREVILLAVDPDNQAVPYGRDAQPGFASFPHSGVAHPFPARVIRLNYSLINAIDLPEVEATFSYIQPLADDQTLLVSARSRYNNGTPEQNAVIYDKDGQLARRMVLGDGIESVQVSHDQRIWVSYFDEGVFGNHGWPYPPMGENGLLCFDTEGHIVWRFFAPGGVENIVDCYALNVATDAVWAYYYTEFPIVKVTSDGKVQGWKNTFRYARALVVDRQRVLLWGGPDEDCCRCIVQTIADATLVSPQTLDLRLPTGESLENARVIGRDSILHAFVGTIWYQFDLRDLPIT